ncbi:hypothetical protein ABEF92_003709 [Exophiala dermatitidis]|nr:hypothetical protein HRR75_001784 [Exophiala dermatitidis]KAJ4556706.1 hypothetical protein HRR78_002369 [Exophiala dermatitidis]
MLNYTFVSLTPSQLEERRRQLDLSGLYAWLSPITLLVSIYFCRQVFRSCDSVSRLIRTDQRPPTPRRSLGQHSKNAPYRSPSSWEFESLVRQIRWILGTTTATDFGPLSTQVVGLLYFLWLVYLAFRATGTDYMHLTKSFGHIAVSQLPIHYLMGAIKSPNSPITLATGLGHERLNVFHRLLGRIIHVLLSIHAVLYLHFFIRIGVLAKRLRDRDVRFGLAAFAAVTLLAGLALPAVRNRARGWYHAIFYRSHVLLSALILPLVWVHVPYPSVRLYIAQTGLIWVLGGLLRRSRQCQKVKATCDLLAGGGDSDVDLIGVNFTVSASSPWARAQPGQHVYLRQASGRVYWKLLQPRNPFTIANMRAVVHARDYEGDGKNAPKGAGETEIQLVLKNTGGPQTSYLADVARSAASWNDDDDNNNNSHTDSEERGRREINPSTTPTTTRAAAVSDPSTVDLLVEGPYGGSGIYIPRLLEEMKWVQPDGNASAASHGPIILIAGGVGATYIIPIYLALMAAQTQSASDPASRPSLSSPGSRGDHSPDNEERNSRGRGRTIKMIWLVKTTAAAQWGIDILTQKSQQPQGQQWTVVGQEDKARDSTPDATVDIYTTQQDGYTFGDYQLVTTTTSVLTPATGTRHAVIKIHRLGRRPDLSTIVADALTPSSSSISVSDSVACSGGDATGESMSTSSQMQTQPGKAIATNDQDSGIRNRKQNHAQPQRPYSTLWPHRHQQRQDSGDADIIRVPDARVSKQAHSQPTASVFICGPAGLARNVRRILGTQVRAGRDIEVFEEVFGF